MNRHMSSIAGRFAGDRPFRDQVLGQFQYLATDRQYRNISKEFQALANIKKGSQIPLGRDIQRATLPVLMVGDIEMRPMEALGIALANAVGVSAAASSFRQPALDHLFGGQEESSDELLLPMHPLIFRYGSPVFASREK